MMRWERRATLCLALLLSMECLAADAFGSARPVSDAILTIRFYNFASVPEAMLGAAQRQTDAVLRAAGIAVTWVKCPVSDADAARDITCPQTHGTHVLLQIVPLAMAAPYSPPTGELGLATYPDAYVFFDRLHEYCSQNSLPEAIVLGEVMA